MVLNMFFRAHFPALLQSPINAGVFTMTINLILVPIASLMTKKPDAAMVENAFACYEKPAQAPLRTTLGK
jgi:Na+(H+)/acetate symporter ActP